MADEPNPNPVGDPQDPPQDPPNPEPTGDPPRPANDSDWYYKRQAEKAAKEAEEAKRRAEEAEARAKALEDEKLTEQERKDKKAEEDRQRAEAAEKKVARLNAIMEAQLPPELAKLVPEDISEPAKYIEENIMPLKSKLQTGGGFGNPTNHVQGDVPNGDKQILDGFNALKARGASERELQAYYDKHYEVFKRYRKPDMPYTDRR